MRLGFIGFGNMGRALAEGLLRKGALAAEEMGACARDFDKLRRNTQRSGIRAFRQAAEVVDFADTVVVAVSKDLPFAQSRFCTTEGIANVVPASDFRAAGFAGAYGVLMADGPLAGLLARAVVVIDKAGKVVYTQLVPEITEEPDYDAAVEAVKAF